MINYIALSLSHSLSVFVPVCGRFSFFLFIDIKYLNVFSDFGYSIVQMVTRWYPLSNIYKHSI